MIIYESKSSESSHTESRQRLTKVLAEIPDY
jgi:hypothetical protein